MPGTLAQQSGERATAIREFKTAIALSPGSVSARMNLAILLSNGGDKAGATEQLRQVIRLYPSYMPAWQMLQSLD